jgi:outer membrane protein OmpA-like peptidoglycan-associated protein
MKKIVFLIVLSLLFSSPFEARSKYIKLIDQGKYELLEKKLPKALLKKPYDVELNLSMAVLFIYKNYQNYNPEKSYNYLLFAEEQYQQIDNIKEIKALEKLAISNTAFIYYKDTICRVAYNDIILENSVKSCEKYLSTYHQAPDKYLKLVTEKRDSIAFISAVVLNSFDSYENFIRTYPVSKQIAEAKNRRNRIAFERALAYNLIDSLENFIKSYPGAFEIKMAKTRIHEIAFAEAQKQNNKLAYSNFILKYPESKQANDASNLADERTFFESTFNNQWLSYKNFIEKYPESTWLNAAKDSLYKICKATKKTDVLKYCIELFSDDRKIEMLIFYHDIFTFDGEEITLNKFYEKYDFEELVEIKKRDYEIAYVGNELNLYSVYDINDFTKFDEYIRMAAPCEKAFVALQRMIAADIQSKNWQQAIQKMNVYKTYFESGNKKFITLRDILLTKLDASIKTQPFGPEINTKNGGEYSPTITADDKYIYFCGKDRLDNIGGEDIYVGKLKSAIPALVIPELSESSSNDAPVSISTDRTMMIFFKNGKLFTAVKNSSGWVVENEMPESINVGNWQADAMITSDGNAFIFASVREGNYDYYTKDKPDYYHGELQYPSDIYICEKEENGQWSEPINLGPTINTIFGDRCPFLHPDMKTLYFSSSGHGGLGKLDVYKSTRLSDTCWTCWSEPVNLGKEINTPDDDWGYKITTNGNIAYFAKATSNNSNNDVYWMNLPVHLRPDLVATVTGKLTDIENRPVEAEIKWEDLQTGKIVGQSKSDPSDGSYFIVLPLGKIYGYYVNKTDYFPISNNLDLRTEKKAIQIEKKVDMVSYEQMTDKSIAVPINNLFFDFGKYEILSYSIPELQRVANIVRNQSIKVEISGHTDNVGDDQSNKVLSLQRANSVKDYLVSQGCDISLLSTTGFGETCPVSNNDTENGRSLNRRVELKFIK